MWNNIYQVEFIFMSNLGELQTTILLYLLQSKRIVNISLTRSIVPSGITADMTTAYTDLTPRDCGRHDMADIAGGNMSVSLAECCLADKCNGYDTPFSRFRK
jgi:hypothetical protein